MGFLRLLRRPVGDDALELEVEQLLRTPGRTERLRATVTCAAETLSTPRRWRIECSLLADDYPIPNAQAAQRGEERDGLIRRQALVGGKPSGRMRSFPAPARFTAGWCLFDALQRLPGDDARVDDFDLLEDLQVVKSGQRLAFRQTTALDWAGRQVLLHGFEQLGSGLLPYTWWLDDARRVVAAVGGMKALVWNPSADATERQP